MDILSRILVHHAPIGLPIVERQSCAITSGGVEPCAIGKDAATPMRVATELEEVDEDAE